MKKYILALALVALGVTSSRADMWDYCARNSAGNLNAANFTDTTTSWGNSTSTSSVSTTASRTGTRYDGASSGANNTVGFTIKCTGDTAVGIPSVWRLWYMVPATSRAGNLVASVAASTGTTLDSHLPLVGSLPTVPYTADPGTPTYTWAQPFSVGQSGFQCNVTSKGAILCYFTNAANVINPAITFRYVSGTISSSSRWYADLFRFERIADCSSIALVGVALPVNAGATTVTVTGVSASASAVTIYVNGVADGSALFPTAGDNVVTLTTPLVKGQTVSATQTIGGQEGCVQSGTYVGGGANPNIRVSLNMRYDDLSGGATLAGPIGAGGAFNTTNHAYGYYIMPNTQGGALPPTGGAVITPSTCWQTVTIDPQTTPQGYIWNQAGAGAPVAGSAVDRSVVTHPWSAIDGFMFAMEDTTDIGPMQVYIANLANGATMIHDWNGEGFYFNGSTITAPANPGSNGLFEPVNYAGTSVGVSTPPPGSTLVACSTNASAPNQALCGTNSQYINWAWGSPGASPAKFLRLVADAPGNATWASYPQIDNSKPITFDILVLPAGQTVGHPVGAISWMDPVTICPGGALNLSVTAKGPGDPANYGQSLPRTFTYQWSLNGTPITGASGTAIVGATDPAATIAYSKAVVSGADNGTYTVVVNDGTCSLTRSAVATISTSSVHIDDLGTSDPGGALSPTTWTLTVNASFPSPCACGIGFGYQWRKNGVAIPGATDSTYTWGGNSLQVSDAGLYSVIVTNNCTLATATSTNIQIAIYDPNVTAVTASCGTPGPGLLGLYWTNQTSANAFSGNPTWTNLNDATVSFDWGVGGPNGTAPDGLPVTDATNYFVIRWVGQFQAPYDAQNYTFYVKSDDGARLWVNGQLLINKWVAQSATEWSGTINLNSASPVDIVLQYFEQTGSASCLLSYSSESIYKAVLNAPTAQLCAADPNTGIPPLTMLTSPTTAILGTPVTLTATVTPETSTVNSVQFFNGATPIGTAVTTPPYTANWTPSAVGVYTNITARTTYGGTHVLNTPPNTLTVTVPPATAVTITNIIGTTLTYGGGSGVRYILLKSATANAAMSAWTTTGLTNFSTPGSFIIPAVQPTDTELYYRIDSQSP